MNQKCPACGRGGKPRSQNQNSYLWGVVYSEMANYTGHSTEEIHEACKQMFLPKQFVHLGPTDTEVPKSTRELTTAEFEEYALRVRVFANRDMGLQIPLPNESL